ncbi:hypothetical protein [Olsenella phocaeensis]|uniref:hypothetical protein n=1 Tax=Olsenella phocaeensis TaxID=1852385 RepID=UPI00101AE5E7|nr:hypothetical protein [Olsenella phocaeensis]
MAWRSRPPDHLRPYLFIRDGALCGSVLLDGSLFGGIPRNGTSFEGPLKFGGRLDGMPRGRIFLKGPCMRDRGIDS